MRKGGKKLGVFDLSLEVKWEGSSGQTEAQETPGEESGEQKIEGTLCISEFAQESDEDDWMIDCSTTATTKHATTCRMVALSELKPLILKRLSPLHTQLLATLD